MTSTPPNHHAPARRRSRLWAGLATAVVVAGTSAIAWAALPQQGGVVDLLTQANVELTGSYTTQYSGFSVAGAGDVNGDGRDDVIIGAPNNSLPGAGFVVYGSATQTNVDLRTLGSQGFQINGVGVGSKAGSSVAAAGDLNGDGLADLIVGAPYADPSSRTDAGASYVVYGSATPTDVDVGSLGSRGFRINGAAADDRSGLSVAGVGDVNGDGRDDVLIGAPYADPSSRSNAGSSYVVFGSATPTDIDLGSLGSQGFRVSGGAAGDESGSSVGRARDMNGDGLNDVIIGAPEADPLSRTAAGASYVIFGSATPADIDLAGAGLTGKGFRISGADAGDSNGYSVDGAGDINGDGRDDLIVGSPFADPSGRIIAGSSYVVYGSTSPADIDLASFGAKGFRIDGAVHDHVIGFSVARAGDVNGDGLDDVIVGAHLASAPGVRGSVRNQAGQSFVVYGSASPTNVDLRSFAGKGFRADGAVGGDKSGYSVAGAGDVNGDGRDDVIIGAPYADLPDRPYAGTNYVVYGFGAASLSYPSGVSGSPGAAITPVVPVVARTGEASFTVTPALPAGLVIDGATGVISGTPSEVASGTYAVTMSDLTGAVSSTVSVAISRPAQASATPSATPSATAAPPPTSASASPTARALGLTQTGPTIRKSQVVLTSQVTTNGPGTLRQEAVRQGARGVTLCTTQRAVSAPGTVPLRCTLSRAVRSQLRKGAIRYTLVTTFTGTAGAPVTKTVRGTLPRTR